MLKLFLLLLAIWLILAILKRQHRHTGAPPPEKSDDMVRCAVCGTHTPKSEAILSAGQYYCCETHFLHRKKE